MVQLQTKNISDQNIICMIVENKLEARGHLYDKYTPFIYGVICNLTEDKPLAEEIFKDAFLQLKEKQILSKIHRPLCSCLLKHTPAFTKQYLKERGIAYSKKSIEEIKVTDKPSSIITEDDMMKAKKMEEKMKAEMMDMMKDNK